MNFKSSFLWGTSSGAPVLVLSLFVLLMSSTWWCQGAEFDYTVEVPKGARSCFYQVVDNPAHMAMELDYQVIDGGDLDINFAVRNPHGTQLASDLRKMDRTHRFEFNQIMGDYEICFDNTFSYQDKVIFFEILIMDKDGNYDEMDYNKLAISPEEAIETMDHVKSASVRLKGALNKAEHYQSLLRAAEARDRAVMENNFKQVNFWSAVHMGCMLFIGGLQLYLIRVLFDDNSKVGKLIRSGTTQPISSWD